MKWSFTSVGLIVFALVGLTILILFQNITTGNENDYYLLKEVTEASMIDAIDMKHYKETGELKIIKDKFVESFTRRFAESTVFTSSKYTINYFDIMEEPPKVTVSINTGIGEYTIYQDTSDYHVANTLSAILEYYGKDGSKTGESYVNGTPLVEKKFTKTYYSIPSSNTSNYSVKQPLNIPDELNHKNIYDVEISKVEFDDNVSSQAELLYALLNREIDWTNTNNNNATKYDKLSFDEIKKINNIKIGQCSYDDISTSSPYCIKWTGVGEEKGTAAIKLKVTWKYKEYEYAE
ncbi:MAG: DUF5411 family protein [Bacilli bacterium]|nr:DUF5411 family protein [Bacilli bacterium]